MINMRSTRSTSWHDNNWIWARQFGAIVLVYYFNCVSTTALPCPVFTSNQCQDHTLQVTGHMSALHKAALRRSSPHSVLAHSQHIASTIASQALIKHEMALTYPLKTISKQHGCWQTDMCTVSTTLALKGHWP
jgi:hypothetical protein